MVEGQEHIKYILAELMWKYELAYQKYWIDLQAQINKEQ